MLRLAPLCLLLACQDIKELGGGAGLDLSFIPGLGQVFQCDVTDGTQLELCYDGESSDLLDLLQANDIPASACGPTQRHAGPCWFHCSSGRGCNAFQGCACFEEQ
jgi:hypothetical protein